jgi:hypothetical protein
MAMPCWYIVATNSSTKRASVVPPGTDVSSDRRGDDSVIGHDLEL